MYIHTIFRYIYVHFHKNKPEDNTPPDFQRVSVNSESDEDKTDQDAQSLAKEARLAKQIFDNAVEIGKEQEARAARQKDRQKQKLQQEGMGQDHNQNLEGQSGKQLAGPFFVIP